MVARGSATSIVLDGAGFTLTNECPQIGLQSGGAGSVTLRDLTFTGDAGSGQGVAAVGLIALENTTIANHGGTGIGTFTFATATDSVIVSNGNHGIGTGLSVIVTNSTIGGNSGHGVTTGAGVTVDGSTISDNDGVGIDADDLVAVTDGVIADNGGGGVLTDGSFDLADTAVTGNGASGATAIDTATLTDTTVAANTGFGVIGGSAVEVVRSTITASTSTGIASFGSVLLQNATVTGNAGFAVNSASVTTVYATLTANGSGTLGVATAGLFASVLADPGSGSNCAAGTTVTSDGYNWADDDSCGLTGPGDVEDPGGDPQLGALAANGGPTDTRLPTTTSALVDAVPVGDCESGPAVGITTDQRGLARPGAFTDGCDVGSVELQGSPPSPPTTTTTTTPPLSPNTAPSTTDAPPPMPTAAPSASAELPATLPRTGSPRLALVVLGGSLLVAIGLALVARRERRAPS